MGRLITKSFRSHLYGIFVFSIPFKSATPPKAGRGERAVFSQLVDYYDKPAESTGLAGRRGGGSSDFQTGEFFTPTPTERAAVLTGDWLDERFYTHDTQSHPQVEMNKG